MQTQTSANNEKFFTKPLIIIFITIFIDLVGFGIVIPVLPFYIESPQFHATPLELGILFASYSTMQFIFSPIMGGISDKYGRRPVLFFSLLGTATGFFIVGAATTLWMIFAGRILDGITGGNISTAQAYIADVTSKENRAKGMGLIGAAFGLGFVFGPAIGGILSKYGNHVPFYFAGAMALCNAVALYFFLPEPIKDRSREEYTRRRNRFAELFDSLRDKRFSVLTIIYFLIVVGFSIMTTSFALYTMERFNYNAEQNGYLFAYIGILAVILQGGIFGRLAKKFGEARLAVAGCVLLAVSLFAVPFVSPAFGGLAGLLVGIAFFSLGNSLASPALTTLASKNASDAEQGKALGILQSGASLARAIGPVIAGVLLNNALNQIDDATIRHTFWTAAAIMSAAFFIAVYFVKTQRSQIIV